MNKAKSLLALSLLSHVERETTKIGNSKETVAAFQNIKVLLYRSVLSVYFRQSGQASSQEGTFRQRSKG